MHVTAAGPEDCAGIAGIHVASWQAAYAGLFPPDYLGGLSIPEREASWKEIVASGLSRTLVARDGSRPVGFVSFGHCRDADAPAGRGEVWALYVAPSAWSTGAGWALWEAARVQMLHAGRSAVSLWVLSGNARGLAFYDAVGFRREAGSERVFERGGARVAEVRLVMGNMTGGPAAERVGKRDRVA